MDLTISSKKIENPLLVELLRKLTVSFSRMHREFYVIGATARDIILKHVVGSESKRRTMDLDIAIAIPNWETFAEVQDVLVADGFEKSRDFKQRFYYREYELDIVPYGNVAKDNDIIYWPPEEDIAMSVKGFDEVLSNSITVSIDNEFSVKIASLHGLFVLKLDAWVDRNLVTSKDAEDMSFILQNYFMANIDRGIHSEVYDWEDFHEYVAGAYWIAFDIANLLKKEHLTYYIDIIKDELKKEEESRLINQIVENTRSLNYDTIRKAWQMIVDVLQDAVKNYEI